MTTRRSSYTRYGYIDCVYGFTAAVVAVCRPCVASYSQLRNVDIVSRTNCKHNTPAAKYWDEMEVMLFRSRSTKLARLSNLSTKIKDLMVPYGVVDPVIVLDCPVGISVALHRLAIACVKVLGARCAQRSLRLIHLSLIAMGPSVSHGWNYFEKSRWRLDVNAWTRHRSVLKKFVSAAAKKNPFEPLHVRQPKWRIGLISYCVYNDSNTKLRILSKSNKKAYSERHGHTLLHFEEPFVSQASPQMNKILALRRNFADFDWLFWVDCDLFFMNPNRTVDTVIRSALARNADASLIITEDGMMLNSGVFLLRCSDWSANFLAKTVDLLSAPFLGSFQPFPWAEQSPMVYLSLLPWIFDGITNLTNEALLSQDWDLPAGYDPRVVLLPQRAFNSYPTSVVEKLSNVLHHEGYEEGDFVVSFNGCSSVLDGETCETLYARYHSLSMQRFQRWPGGA
eukprot:TRINITY_DN21944_c0_g1_i1.p1 TRINITY_DN21944_c0_g1~~TRINITY_DN21944_c0_g1_i1.p1  ORF type:complete len:452 (+),score=52.94 TRINITY_DN21944_c0_g1_i1:84-1439(+)